MSEKWLIFTAAMKKIPDTVDVDAAGVRAAKDGDAFG